MRLFIVVGFLLFMPLAASAQGSPFNNGFTALQTLFTGTVAKVASLIAIVIGGYSRGSAVGVAALVSIGGSDGFVSFTAAPIATGWSEPVPGRGLHPLKSSAFSRRTRNSDLSPVIKCSLRVDEN